MITVGVVCLFLIGISNADLARILPSFAKQFRAPIPLPIFYEVSKDIKANLTKESSLNNLFLSWIDKNPYEKMFLLLIEDQWLPNSSGNIEINQQIYLLTSTFEVHEKYTVNNHTVMNKVGHFNNVTFMFEKGLTENALARRADFHGAKLTGLTEEWLGIEIGNLENAPYDVMEDRYDVTNLVSGAFYDILKNLECSLNFTTKLYKRKSGGWGLPVEYPNGTIELNSGMVKDLVTGSADLIVSSITMLYERHLIMDFLLPIVPEETGIFIKKRTQAVGFDFKVFIKPFDKLTWLTILSSSFVTSLFIIAIWKYFDYKGVSLFKGLEVFTTTLQSHFGSANLESFGGRRVSMKIIIFTSLLMGNIVWMSYNGSLLSELINFKVIKPFYDWETFLQSLHHLNTDPKDVSIGSLFALSKPDTIYRAVLDNAMDDMSFNEPYKSMKRTAENPKHAYYGEVYSVLSYQDMACELELIVDVGSKHMTYGVRRGLPYAQFLHIEVGKMKEYGLLQNYLRRDAPKSPNCFGQMTEEEGADAIRFEKVVLPFTIFAIGSIFAIIIMSFEKCCWSLKIVSEDSKNKGAKEPDLLDVAYQRQDKLQAYIQKTRWLATWQKHQNQPRKLPHKRYTM